MRLTITILAVTVCATLVSSLPLPEEDGLHSEALDKLVMVEADNETALRSKRTIGILRQLFPEISQDVNPEAENQVSEVGSESQNNEVRVQFADEQTNNAKASELTPLDDIEANEEDENRNKRFLNFGFGATGGGAAGGGGSGAGSGNFLFDIIRLVAGSGSSASGQAGNSSGGTAPGRTDDTQEAIPGPVTRLFVIANRGISNLIQDLILRLAATSERIVNFKARLITSII